MTKNAYINFLDEDVEFIAGEYPNLAQEEKFSLWLYRLTFDFRDDNPGYDPLQKFNKENHAKWREQEPDFDKILDKIIQEGMPAWNIWYKDWKTKTIKEEIYHRVGR